MNIRMIFTAGLALAATAVSSGLSAAPLPSSLLDALRPIRDDSALYNYTTLDFTTDTTINAVNGINDVGGIAGVYNDADGHFHGFSGHLGDRTLTKVDVPNAVETYVIGIANDGSVSGIWVDSNVEQHGFILRNGVYTTIDVPGAAPTSRGRFEAGTGLGSSVYGGNALGDVVGQYADAKGVAHAFSLRDGVYETIDPPGTSKLPGGSGGASAIRITDDGTIAGNYYRALKLPRGVGFIRRGNSFETVAPPQAAFTQVQGLSVNGCATGFYYTAAQLTRYRGFTYCQGEYARVIHPQGDRLTTVSAIAVDGTIVGEYLGADGITHGYIATRR